jgi:hypothetical protein
MTKEEFTKQFMAFKMAHPDFNPLFLTSRPSDMSHELYNLVRKSGNKLLNKYLHGKVHN